MKAKFEHYLDTKAGKFILRGKLRKDERFSLCLIRRELSDRWSKDFNPLQIHSICSKVGNVKKMLVIWEILFNYTEFDKNYHLDCIFNPNESRNEENQRIYLVIEEKTKYQVSKIPLPLDHMPFTYEEYQENCKYLYNRIFQLECIKLAQEKEINELKQQINKERSTMSQTERNMKSNIKKLKTKIQAKEQKELVDRLSKPKYLINKDNYTAESLLDFSLPQASKIISMHASKNKSKLNKSNKSQKNTKKSLSNKSSNQKTEKSSKSTYSSHNGTDLSKDYSYLTEQRPSSAFSPSQSYQKYSSSKNYSISQNSPKSDKEYAQSTYSSHKSNYYSSPHSSINDKEYSNEKSYTLSSKNYENDQNLENGEEEEYKSDNHSYSSRHTQNSYHTQHSGKDYKSQQYSNPYSKDDEREYYSRSVHSSNKGDNYDKSYYSGSNRGEYETGSSLNDYDKRSHESKSSKKYSSSSKNHFTKFSSPTEIFITDDEEDESSI